LSLLPLSIGLVAGDAGFMSKAARHAPPLRQLASAVSDLLADWAYAQRKLAELRLAPGQYVFNPGGPPQTYAEFLHRTSGVLPHEPSARARAQSGR
jgi:hypothetical protein